MELLQNYNINPAFSFLIKFNLLAIPLYVVLAANVQFYWLQAITADIVYLSLNFFGFSPAINGILISIPIQGGSWAGLINSACTGWKSAFLFFALVMASHKKINKKLMAMIVIPTIFLVNVVRIVFMFWVAQTNLLYFEIIHSLLWSWGLVAIVLGLWVVWLRLS
jgi:exosortase/archaeosortase family protein